jgi:hypothetical protein
VLHLSCHRFTPKLRGVRRTTDIGLLFDPARPAEAAFCRRWRTAILAQGPRLRVRYNDPYPGVFPSLVGQPEIPARRRAPLAGPSQDPGGDPASIYNPSATSYLALIRMEVEKGS